MKTRGTFVIGILLGAASMAAEKEPDGKKAEMDDSIAVTVRGVLRTGVVAVGGETTGVTITAKKITWELSFDKNAELQRAAEKLDGKQVVVQGSLERRAGVEVKERWIVTVTGLAAAGKAATDKSEKQSFRATPRRADSRIRFESEGDTTIIDVVSKFGIDQATIQRLDAQWPKTMLVRLHLRGLESFKAGRDDITIAWSASAEGAAPRVALHQGGKETDLSKDSPYYTKARVVGDGKARCFEVPLPAKLFEGNPSEITLHWIDFYRN
jgi:hypothetical protein